MMLPMVPPLPVDGKVIVAVCVALAVPMGVVGAGKLTCGVTVMVCWTGGAAEYAELPAWSASTTTVPGPVYVSVNPLSVAGPLMTLKVTIKPEVEVAESVAELDAETGDGSAAKLMVCAI